MPKQFFVLSLSYLFFFSVLKFPKKINFSPFLKEFSFPVRPGRGLGHARLSSQLRDQRGTILPRNAKKQNFNNQKGGRDKEKQGGRMGGEFSEKNRSQVAQSTFVFLLVVEFVGEGEYI